MVLLNGEEWPIKRACFLLPVFATATMTARFEPMKYGLRSLMIVVTLACLVAGSLSRIAYFRQCAVFHECEAVIPAGTVPGDAGRFKEEYGPLAGYYLVRKEKQLRHETLAKQYREAMFRPWRTVDESQQIEFRPQQYLHP
jgi:hypothetical protein